MAVAADPRRLRGAAVAGLVLVTVIAYLPALGGGWLWDDDEYVRSNVALRTLGGLADLWRLPATTPQYYPLTFTSFWLEYRLWGAGPLGYHATNVALHAVNAVLVWRVLAGLGVPGALGAAALFALHPVEVESVAWVAERKNVLSGLFALLATLSWMRWLQRGGVRAVIATAACFTAALLAKTQVCTLPAILFLLAWWKKPERLGAASLRLAPLGLIALVGVGLTVGSERALRPEPPLPQLDVAERIVVAGRAVWFYVGKLVWPHPLAAVYGHWPVNASRIEEWMWPVTAAAVPVGCWLARGRLGRAPTVAAVAFLAALAPVLGLARFNFMRFSFVADHFQYLASIVPFAAIAATVTQFTNRAPAGVLAAIVLVALGTTTWQRAAVHRDEETLWRDNIRVLPDSVVARSNLGKGLVEQGRYDEAIEQFTAAVRVDPRLGTTLGGLADALKGAGRLEEALAQYEHAAAVQPRDPIIFNNWGVALGEQGDLEGAGRAFAAAIRLDPSFALPEENWGALLLTDGQPAAAEPHLARAVALDGSSASARVRWAETLHRLDRSEAAADALRAAVRLDPSHPLASLELGMVLLDLGRPGEAAPALRTAVELTPDSAAAHHHLGVALGMIGRVEDALRELATAAGLAPTDAAVQNHWGVALAAAGRRDEAVARFQEALRLRPDDPETRANLDRVLAGAARTNDR